jgi:hypothetical protein
MDLALCSTKPCGTGDVCECVGKGDKNQDRLLRGTGLLFCLAIVLVNISSPLGTLQPLRPSGMGIISSVGDAGGPYGTAWLHRLSQQTEDLYARFLRLSWWCEVKLGLALLEKDPFSTPLSLVL